MPKAGYCKECKKNVWLKEDGTCQFGHPSSGISYTYETQPGKTSQPFSQWFKKQTLLAKGLIIGGIAFLLLLCVALASLSNQEKKEAPQVEPKSTYEKPTPPSDTTPPELTITQPADNSVVDKNQVTISGKTEPEATLKLNDQQQTALSDGSFSFLHTLNDGKNVLWFTSTDKAGNTTTKEVTVSYNPPPPAPQPPPQPPPSPPPPSPDGQFVGNRRSDLLHNLAHGSCQNYVNMMSESNKVFFSSEQEGINAGYQPCKKCY